MRKRQLKAIHIFRIVSTFFAMLVTLSISAQKENYNWAFGQHAGLSWNATQSYTGTAVFGTSGGNVALTGVPTSWQSAMVTNEGCFAVSTSDGQMMFYSDGITIWDKNNNPMPNGAGLTGDPSSNQSGIIIPYPGQGGKYIAITIGYNQANNLSYSVIDMSLNGGLGDVVAGQKNIPFTGAVGNTGEVVTATVAANKRDYWIIALGRNGGTGVPPGTAPNTSCQLNVWKVDLDGVHAAAVTANMLTIPHGDGPTVGGGLRFSQDGTKFWLNGFAAQFYAFGNFDPATGTFSNLKLRNQDASLGGSGSYQAEFSPSGQYIYVSSIYGDADAPTATPVNQVSGLAVYDFNALMAAANPNTVAPLWLQNYTGRQVNDGSVDNLHFGTPLMGPNNRLYIVNAFTHSMFVVPNPDADPTNLKIYKLQNILGNGWVLWGLPVYTGIYFQILLTPPTATAQAPAACAGQPAAFKLSVTGGIGGEIFSYYTLDWGDGSPLVTNSSPQLNSTYNYTHTYAESGNYTIVFTAYDLNNNPIAASSGNITILVSNCQLPVNPNVRSRLNN